jgi:hypothetical protein
MSDHKEPQATLDRLKITVESVFVPFSKSRHAKPKNGEKPWPSLNWKVTVKRDGRDVLTTDYSAGVASCTAKADRAPATYRAKDRRRMDGTFYPGTTSNYRRPTEMERRSDYLEAWRAAEIESGVAMEHSPFVGDADFKPRRVRAAGETSSKTLPILPDPADVIHSLVMDSSVLDAGGFEGWAGDFGYDTDSRSAEATYRACLEIALKMRAAFGDSGMAELQTAFGDY